jgi:hypothetical protein
MTARCRLVPLTAPQRFPAVPTTVCGSSSRLVQVTFEPALTTRVVGLNMTSLMTICVPVRWAMAESVGQMRQDRQLEAMAAVIHASPTPFKTGNVSLLV